jgi:FAD/FMN-containing dehydrogenase
MATQTVDRATVSQFVAGIRGEVLSPGSAGYEEGRKLFNGLIDKRPFAIARCLDARDVVAAVNLARASGLEISVKSGGHGISGSALSDGGLTIDLSAMKRIEVDPSKRTVRAEAGVTWGEFDAATQAHGLAVTGGRMSTTGIAGLTLGSGSGWLERTFGFTCDNLLAAEVVTADGRILRASESENGDLFWGLCGGGGNFGIVTAFEYRLHLVGPLVLAGMVVHPQEAARDVLCAYRDFMATAPDEVGGAFACLTAPPAPFIPEAARGKPAAAMIMMHAGPIAEAERVLAPLRKIGKPLVDVVQPMPYTAVQKLTDPGNPPGLNRYFKADFIDELSDAAIDVFLRQAASLTSPLTAVLLQPLGGALARIPAAATPLRRRDAAYAYHALTTWADDRHDHHIGWTRALADAMQPFATGGIYLTYIGDEGEERIRDAYGPEKYARLVALKDRYDPTNLFHLNQNIRPSEKAGRA